jgi:hypothetical protein
MPEIWRYSPFLKRQEQEQENQQLIVDSQTNMSKISLSNLDWIEYMSRLKEIH